MDAGSHLRGDGTRPWLVGALLCGVAWAATRARRPSVSTRDVAVFRSVNGLPDALHPVVWPVMQWGSLAAVPVSAIVTWRSGRRDTAVRLGVAGFGAWLAAKPVKRAVGRNRPGAYMDAVNIRGPEQRGLGFPSGHAAVSAAMAIAVAPDVGNAGRAAALASAAVVAMSRVYIGSHFPFDALAGTLLGGAVGLAVRGLEPTRLPGVSSRG